MCWVLCPDLYVHHLIWALGAPFPGRASPCIQSLLSFRCSLRSHLLAEAPPRLCLSLFPALCFLLGIHQDRPYCIFISPTCLVYYLSSVLATKPQDVGTCFYSPLYTQGLRHRLVHNRCFCMNEYLGKGGMDSGSGLCVSKSYRFLTIPCCTNCSSIYVVLKTSMGLDF